MAVLGNAGGKAMFLNSLTGRSGAADVILNVHKFSFVSLDKTDNTQDTGISLTTQGIKTMKLEIDLTDREEVAAAVPLLQLILDNAPATCGDPCSFTSTTHTVGDMSVTDTTVAPVAVAPSLHAEFVAAQAADTRPPITGQSDPAAIFGGAPVAPLAPSIPPAPTPSIVVLPPPAVTAPTMTTPGAASSVAVAGSVELDAKGLPWDERIHAGSKAKIADGSWRMKKQVSADLVTQVEAELRAALGNVAPPVAPTVTAQVPAAPVGVASPTISASVPAAPVADPASFGSAGLVPQAPAVTATPNIAPSAITPASDPTTFEQLMPRITAAVAAGQMPPTAVGAACAAHGLASVVSLQQNPQYVPLVWATLRASHPGM